MDSTLLQVEKSTAASHTDASAGASPLTAARPRLTVTHCRLEQAEVPEGLLALVRFDAGTPAPAAAPLTIDVALASLEAAPVAELWQASGPVHTGNFERLRFAHDEHHLFAVIELDEREHGGIRGAARAAYDTMRRFQAQSAFPHLLRMWNYMDAINRGEGDEERYRQFCVGRVQGLGSAAEMSFPAATAIGRKRGTDVLQVFWLAATAPGTAIENPRQVSAYRYPRVHGPVSPSFSRATLAPDRTLLISGTASIVGHVSHHHDDALEQLEETLRNISALVEQSGKPAAAEPDLLKVYLRDASLHEPVAARLAELRPGSDTLFLCADVCRRELLIEIESVRA